MKHLLEIQNELKWRGKKWIMRNQANQDYREKVSTAKSSNNLFISFQETLLHSVAGNFEQFFTDLEYLPMHSFQNGRLDLTA